MLIAERIRIIVEREIERLYNKAINTDVTYSGLSEDEVKELKALYEIAKLQGLDKEENPYNFKDIGTQTLLESLKKKEDNNG